MSKDTDISDDQSMLERVTDPDELHKLLWPALFIQLLALAVPWLTAANLLLPNGQVAGSDFIVFYTAAKMALGGEGLVAYQLQPFLAAQRDVIPGIDLIYPWLYPPGLLATLAPLGALGYGAAYLAWNVFSAAVFAFGCYKLFPHRMTVLAVMAVPFTLVCLLHGQVSLLLAGLLALMLRHMLDGKWLMAGIMLGLATLKPQIALWFFLPVVAFRLWPMVAGIAIGAALIHGLGLLVYGLDGIASFITAGQSYSQTFSVAALQFDKIPTLLGFLASINEDWAGSAAQACLVGGLFAMVLFSLRLHRLRQAGRDQIGADAGYLFCILFALIWISIPYLYQYDLVIMVPPVLAMLVLYRRAGVQPPRWFGPWALVLCLLPVLAMKLGTLASWIPNLAVLGGIMLGVMLFRLAGPLVEAEREQFSRTNPKVKRLRNKRG